MKKTILLTGWAWYIWSHCAVLFLEAWFDVIIIDNFINSSYESLKNIEKITKKQPKFYEVDLLDKMLLEKVFLENKIDFVIHFAWLKSVWESSIKPFLYYENNIIWSLNLFQIMEKYNVKDIIFSSTATVYSPKNKSPLTEGAIIWETTNPYSTTKFIIEQILIDLSKTSGFRVVNLRYFNPIWAHNSWLIWEDPKWIPNNLLPFIMKVVSKELPEIKVFWGDYDTLDWTWVRDYIHVVDLVNWHFKAYKFFEHQDKNGFFEVFNLWTWKWTSVLEIINITKKVTWSEVPYSVVSRREGDLASFYCNPEKAKKILNWEAKYTLEDAIKDSLNFINNK